MDLAPGKKLAARYTLVGPAGFGPPDRLWAAKNDATGAEVLIAIVEARLGEEAAAAARLQHRNLVCVHDVLETEGALAVVMEPLRGKTLAALLAETPKLGVDAALDIALPMLAGLANAHREGVVHGGITPESIFLAVDPDGFTAPKVIDVGLADADTDFRSPEQVRGARGDARSDVFSAATVVYTMLAGSNPFAGGGVLRQHPAVLDDVPPAIGRVVARALEKAKGARPADAGELAALLRDASGRVSPTPTVLTSSTQASVVSLPAARATLTGPIDVRAPQRRRLRVIGAGSFAGVAAAAVLVVVSGLERAPPTPPAASQTTELPPTPDDPAASLANDAAAPKIERDPGP